MVKKLLYLNGLSIFAVVLYHAETWGIISMFFWTHRYRSVVGMNFDQVGNAEYYGSRIIEQLVPFAIPAFVFVSGYFIAAAAGRENKPLKWGIVLNRIKFLAIPYLLWSMVMILISVVQGARYSISKFLFTLITGDAAGPYYFVPMLIQLYLLSPALLFLVRKQWKLMLTLSAILQVFVWSVRYISIFLPDSPLFSILPNPTFFTAYTFWFILGIVFVLRLKQVKSFLARYQRWFLFGIPIFFIAGFIEWEVLFHLSGEVWLYKRATVIDQFYALCVILSFLSFDEIPLPLFEQVTNIGAKSYAIFLTHIIVIISTARIIYHIAPFLMEYQILFQPVLIIMGLGVPLLLIYMVERSFLRKYYKYILG